MINYIPVFRLNDQYSQARAVKVARIRDGSWPDVPALTKKNNL